MTRHWPIPADWIFEKGYGSLSFAKNMSKITGENIEKNENGKYNQKRLDHGKQSATDAIKTTSKRIIQKKLKQLPDLISNKITVKIKSQEFRHIIL